MDVHAYHFMFRFLLCVEYPCCLTFFVNLDDCFKLCCQGNRKMLQFSWKDCGDTSYSSNISQISLMPDPLDLPGNITLGFNGVLGIDLQAPIKV